MEAHCQWNDVTVHSAAEWTKLLLYAFSFYDASSLTDFLSDYYGDTFFQSAGTTYVSLPLSFNECLVLTHLKP
jgi:hypothetical protein